MMVRTITEPGINRESKKEKQLDMITIFKYQMFLAIGFDKCYVKILHIIIIMRYKGGIQSHR